MKAVRLLLSSGWIGALLVLVSITNAHALPSFARQTGQACVACHTSWPELTPYGRYFKLSGYTLGRNLWVEAAHKESFPPLSIMLQYGVTWINKPTQLTGDTDPVTGLPVSTPVAGTPDRNDDPLFPGGSVFLGGKFTDYLGAFMQWTLDTQATDANGNNVANKFVADNTDFRAVYQTSLSGKELILGLDLNNNPTVQDASNSTPAWGFPFTSSPIAPGIPAEPIITGLGAVATGYGVYAFWDKMLYGEISFYQASDGIFSFLGAGAPVGQPGGTRLSGTNPYWRLYVTKEWGPHNVLVGTYGMQVNVFPDPQFPEGATDKFTDYGFDAQYQYITDPHVLTLHANYIHEKQSWSGSSLYSPNTLTAQALGAPLTQTFAQSLGVGGPAVAPTNSSDSLNSFKIWATYYYQRKYGATVAAFTTSGSSDPGLYGIEDANLTALLGTSVLTTTTPNTSGYILELDWLPFQDVKSDFYSAPYNSNLRLMLQYTGFTKVQGTTSNIDGFGRSASANNSLFLNLWVAF
jgi:hypothetical protein